MESANDTQALHQNKPVLEKGFFLLTSLMMMSCFQGSMTCTLSAEYQPAIQYQITNQSIRLSIN